MVAGSRIRAGRPPWWPLKNSRNQQIQKCYNSRFLLVTLADVVCGRSWGLGSGFGHEEARFGSQIWSPKSQTHHIYIYVYMYICIHVYIYTHIYVHIVIRSWRFYGSKDWFVHLLWMLYFFLDFCVYCFTLVEWVVELVVELLLVVLLVLLIVLVLPSFLFLLVLVILLEIIKY